MTYLTAYNTAASSSSSLHLENFNEDAHELSFLINLLANGREGQILSSDTYQAIVKHTTLENFFALVKTQNIKLVATHCDRNYSSRYAVIIPGVAVLRLPSEFSTKANRLLNVNPRDFESITLDAFHDLMKRRSHLPHFCF
jgi:hypothetical protein